MATNSETTHIRATLESVEKLDAMIGQPLGKAGRKPKDRSQAIEWLVDDEIERELAEIQRTVAGQGGLNNGEPG